jgi:hypothetical protein
MTEIIATLALLTSMALLIVQYRNQVERRHGEIARLRSDLLRRSASAHQRLISVQMHYETARIELRHIPDCDDKYESIEKMPALIDDVRRIVRRQKQITDALEGIDTTKSNKSKTLLILQTIEGNIRALEEDASSSEQKALVWLERIRSQQERG